MHKSKVRAGGRRLRILASLSPLGDGVYTIVDGRSVTLAMLISMSVGLAGEPDLAGSWALKTTSVVAAKVPVIGQLKSSSWSWMLIELERDGDGWRAHHRVCESKTSGKVVKTVIPPEFVAAIPPKSYPVEIAEVDGKTTYVADTLPFTLGFDPAVCARPPETTESSCLIDVDGDGHPGVTIHVRPPLFPWIEIYLSQMSHLKMSGWVVNEDLIAGSIAVEDALTGVVGASRSMFARSPTTTVLNDESTFSMRRLPAGATCADVVE